MISVLHFYLTLEFDMKYVFNPTTHINYNSIDVPDSHTFLVIEMLNLPSKIKI